MLGQLIFGVLTAFPLVPQDLSILPSKKLKKKTSQESLGGLNLLCPLTHNLNRPDFLHPSEQLSFCWPDIVLPGDPNTV